MAPDSMTLLNGGVLEMSDETASINKTMGKIGVELLTRAALCAASMALIAGMAAALFYRS
ncbi:MAG: hypothetical protein HYX72_04430 [Acidobacteria bacterium]|nr:hypothetical protein [Acidobacteriota bacterium]